MSESDEVKLVERLRAFADGILKVDGDRDLGFQSNITTTASMAMVDEFRSAADTISRLVAENGKYKKEWEDEIKANIDLAFIASERRLVHQDQATQNRGVAHPANSRTIARGVESRANRGADVLGNHEG